MYYKDYASLETHFNLSHFLCPYDSCKANCYVAFRSENEVSAHLEIMHRKTDSKINANTLLNFQDGKDENVRKHKPVKEAVFELKDEEGKDFNFYFSQKYQMIHAKNKDRYERD